MSDFFDSKQLFTALLSKLSEESKKEMAAQLLGPQPGAGAEVPAKPAHHAKPRRLKLNVSGVPCRGPAVRTKELGLLRRCLTKYAPSPYTLVLFFCVFQWTD